MNARLLKSLGIPVLISTMLLSYWAWLFRRAILVAFVALQIWSLGGSFDWQLPAGMDVVSGPIPTGLGGAFWKAAAILFVALTLSGRQPGLAVTPTTPKSMAVSLALIGLITAIFGLLLPASVLAHPISFVICLVYGYDLLRTAKPTAQSQEQSDESISIANQAGLALSGIGVALGLQALNMRIELWGLGEPAENSLYGALFLGLAAFGALAFAGYLKKPGAQRAVLAAGPLYVCVAVLASFALLLPMANASGLEAILGAYGADLSLIGQVKGLLCIGARGLFLPALGLGVVLACATRADELRALGFGLALGVTLMPLLLSELAGTSILAAPGGGLVCLAMLAAVLPLIGWALVTFTSRTPVGGRQRLVTASLLLPAVALAIWLPKHPVQPLSPWLSFESEPSVMVDTPNGLLTVEMTRQGRHALLLDRYLMTPDVDSLASDQAQLRASLDYLAASHSTSASAGQPPLRVLLAGQLTSPRKDAFEEWSIDSGYKLEFDWTVPWHDELDQVMPMFEILGPERKRAIAPGQARTQLAKGEYDLVLSLATYGPEIVSLSAEAPPMAPGLIAGSGGTAGDALSIVWNDSRVPLSSSRLPNRALLAGSDLEHLAVGLVTWPDGRGFEPGTYDLGPRLPLASSGLDRLRMRPELRVFGDRARLFARLAQSNPPVDAAFFRAIQELLEKQGLSSPWDELDVRFEIDSEALQALAEATPAETSPFQRMTWNHLARVLVAKRLPQLAYDVLPGLLAKTEGSWPELEYSLSRAYQEFLMPEEAAELLAPLFDADLLNLVPLLEYAAAEGQSGNWARAAEVLDRALAADPHNHDIERHLAIAELQSGNSAGEDRIRHLMDAEPDDPAIQELGAYLLPGPMPPAPMGFDPSPLASHDDDEH
ncbi:MAG: tetratricopeptide (TPR) repeat protein [Planctomycetota bacterium]|jgi:tetratricopeptide (TPR) repeat protein